MLYSDVSPLATNAIVARCDPLDPDRQTDEQVVTTRRCLVRLALVAAETATRFERDGVTHDPMAWMLAPRRLFGDRSAIDACLTREDCMRAILLHGLSLELDAGPADLDHLFEGEEEQDEAETDGTGVSKRFLVDA